MSPPFPTRRLQLFCGFLRFFASRPPSPILSSIPLSSSPSPSPLQSSLPSPFPSPFPSGVRLRVPTPVPVPAPSPLPSPFPSCARVCVCVLIEFHITAQSGYEVYSFYATACNPPGGYFLWTHLWLEMRVHTATTHLPTTTALGRNPTPSTSTTTLYMGTKTREMVDRLVPLQYKSKGKVARRLAQQIETGI